MLAARTSVSSGQLFVTAALFWPPQAPAHTTHTDTYRKNKITFKVKLKSLWIEHGEAVFLKLFAYIFKKYTVL